MELGGNKNAEIYYQKNQMYQDGRPNHKAPQLAKYKQDLLKKVEIELGSHVAAQPTIEVSKPLAMNNPNIFNDNSANMIGGLSNGQNLNVPNTQELKPKQVQSKSLIH